MTLRRLILDQIEPVISSPEAIVITGMRRTGKTTLLQTLFNQINIKNKIFLDMENPLNRKYFEEENYERIKQSLEFLGLDFTKPVFIFLDEIQFVRSIPSVIKYFIDHYKVKFFLTGSASFYLKNLFSESLTGRKIIFELFPLGFNEFLVFKEKKFNIPDNPRNVTRTMHDELSTLYNEYVLFGGFPGVVLKENVKEKEFALEDIFTSFFQLEVLYLGDFRRNDIIRDLMLLLMQRTGTRLDILKLSKDLNINRLTLTDYISFLEGTYFIKLVKPLSMGKDIEIRKSPKVYICDSGLMNRLVRVDEGYLFENSVFQNLRLRGEVNYYQQKNGLEIDFIQNKETAFEVKSAPSPQDIRRLTRISSQLGLKDNLIISKKHSELDNITYAFMLK